MTPAHCRLAKAGDGIWIADAQSRLLGSPWPLRMTCIDVGGAGWVHSPVPLTPELRADVDAALPVRFVIAPNRYHHLHAAAWLAAYPAAGLYAAPGLAQKRPDLPVRAELGDVAPPEWSGHLEQLVLRAIPESNEVVFYHAQSRTLILTDLAFNVREAGWNPVGLFLRAAGAVGRFGPSRITRRLIRDRALARQHVERMLAWPFERIVVSHGAVVESGGREALRRAFEWL